MAYTMEYVVRTYGLTEISDIHHELSAAKLPCHPILSSLYMPLDGPALQQPSPGIPSLLLGFTNSLISLGSLATAVVPRLSVILTKKKEAFLQIFFLDNRSSSQR